MRYGLLALCALVLVAAGIGLRREYPAAVLLRGTYTEIVFALQHLDPENFPPSARTLREMLSTCAETVQRNVQLRLNDSVQAAVRQNCLGLAENVLAQAPSSARARALALVTSPGEAITPGIYRLAREAAPFEPWPLATRLAAAERILPGNPSVSSEIMHDIESALQSDWGRRFLARAWLQNEALRTIIQAAAETRPPEEQNAFLRLLRSETQSRG